jgi:hypothetical protein
MALGWTCSYAEYEDIKLILNLNFLPSTSALLAKNVTSNDSNLTYNWSYSTLNNSNLTEKILKD